MHDFIYTNSKKIETFYIQKSIDFAKSKTISVTFFYKKLDTLCHAIFNENFQAGIYIQKA